MENESGEVTNLDDLCQEQQPSRPNNPARSLRSGSFNLQVTRSEAAELDRLVREDRDAATAYARSLLCRQMSHSPGERCSFERSFIEFPRE